MRWASPATQKGPTASADIERLRRHPCCEQVSLSPLPLAEHEAFFDELLDFAPSTRGHLVEKTLGNPGFATRLVEELVRANALAPTQDGFVLDEGFDAELPASLKALWMDRIDRTLARMDPSCRIALQLAALLGDHVHLGVWRQVCQEAQIEPGCLDTLVGRLQEDHLAHRHGDGWAFGSAPFREAVVRQCRQDGTWVELHRACARGLRTWSDASPLQLARHLEQAGELAAASSVLLDALELHADDGLRREAHRLLSTIGVANRAVS